MDDLASLSVFGLGAMRLAKRSPDHGINETDHQIPTPYDGEGGRRPDERGSHFSRKTDAKRTSRFHSHPALRIIGRGYYGDSPHKNLRALRG